MLNLTNENYYSVAANKEYLSVSQFKDFAFGCEAKALAKLNGWAEPTSDAFLVGSYIHSAIEGPTALQNFIDSHPELFCSTGKNKGELKAEYRHADTMIQTLMTDELCTMMLQGANEQIITADLFGVKWKARIDILAPDEGRIVDLKTVKSIRERYWNADKGRYESFVECYGYTLQMAVYSELERLYSRRFERLEPYIVAISKEDVPDKAVICFDEQTMEAELQTVREKLPRVMAVKEGRAEPKRCNRCRYCRSTNKAQIIHFMSLLEAN